MPQHVRFVITERFPVRMAVHRVNRVMQVTSPRNQVVKVQQFAYHVVLVNIKPPLLNQHVHRVHQEPTPIKLLL